MGLAHRALQPMENRMLHVLPVVAGHVAADGAEVRFRKEGDVDRTGLAPLPLPPGRLLFPVGIGKESLRGNGLAL